MNDKIVEKLTKMVSRRGILASLTAGAAALASSLLGNSRASAATFQVACCHLCEPSTTPCTDCACSWSWYCTDDARCVTYSCFECYLIPNYCGPLCLGVVKCSRAIRVGPFC
jgi:hypothetical protein